MAKQYSERFLQAFAEKIAKKVVDAMFNATASGSVYRYSPSERIEGEMPQFIAYAKKAVRYEFGEGPPPWEESKQKRSSKKKKTRRSR